MVIPSELKQLYPFAQNSFKVSTNCTINYVDEGEGEPILMLHGNPTWSFFYRDLIKKFKHTNRVIAPDHIGCGLSDKPQDYDYTLDNHIQNVEKLIAKLDLKNITLIVHDWGGAIGFGVATRNPDNIKKIVVLNTAAYTSTLIPKRIGICKLPIIGEWLVRTFNAFAWPATFMTTTKPLSKEIKKGFLYPYNNYRNRIATARFVKDIPLNSKHGSYSTLAEIEKRLSEVKCDKLILWGKKDFCFNMNFFEKWKEIYPSAQTHIFENAGHYLLEDEGEQISNKIEEFLK